MRFVADDLVAIESDGPRLIAGRDRATGELRFPLPRGAAADRWERVTLGTRGRLWSWTVQRFAPKPPYDGDGGDAFRPYAVGYVELPGELIVEARLEVRDFADLRLGAPMRLTTIDYRRDADGPVKTFAFMLEDDAR